MSSFDSRVSKRTVFAVIRVVGFHAWEGAPPRVGYLSSSHRHVFTIRAEYVVSHGDRDVEFHIAQGWLRDAVSTVWSHNGDGYQFGGMSCEDIAERLCHGLSVKPNAIEVWEDDENGSRVEFESA